MNAPTTTLERIGAAVAGLGHGPLDEPGVATHLRPLFSRALARDCIYLANHSLGRPLDAMADDVREALDAWYTQQGGAWDAWGDEMAAFRARLGRLCGVEGTSIVPKTSAGAGLRAVLGSFDRPPRVVTTGGEFDSIDVILREHAHRGRLALSIVEASEAAEIELDDLLAAIVPGTDLVVVSQVMFQTGQRLAVEPIVERARACGARVLLDIYHALGVFPIDLTALGVDFAVGGSYKYLRGGPGACFLYVAPRHLHEGLRTLDTGWFAKEAPFSYARPHPPRFAAGGDGWLESTPPVTTWYQARSGQAFTLAIGVDRLRSYSLSMQQVLKEALAARGIDSAGATSDRGAFVVVQHQEAGRLAAELRQRGVETDARGPWLRLCPDLLTTEAEIMRAVQALAALVA